MLVFQKAEVARYQGKAKEALTLANAARDLFVKADDQLHVALVDDFAGGIAWESGDFELAAGLHQSAADIFGAAGRVVEETRALNNLGTAISPSATTPGHMRSINPAPSAVAKSATGWVKVTISTTWGARPGR